MITISIYLYIDTKKSAILVLIHLHWFLRIHMQLWSKSTFVLIFREKHRSMLTPVTRLQHMHIMYQDGVLFQTDLLFVCWQAAESSSVNRSWSNWFSFPSYCCFTFYEYICFTQLSYFDEKREKKSQWVKWPSSIIFILSRSFLNNTHMTSGTYPWPSFRMQITQSAPGRLFFLRTVHVLSCFDGTIRR